MGLAGAHEAPPAGDAVGSATSSASPSMSEMQEIVFADVAAACNDKEGAARVLHF